MCPYNPKIHHRKSIRLQGYDYSQVGLYFITICCQDRLNRFGSIKNGEMILNEYGEIAFDEWEKLPQRFSNFKMDVFQIMPNHMHAIIALTVRATLAVAPNINNESRLNSNEFIGQPQGIAPTPQGIDPTVSGIVGAYKSLVTNRCLDFFKLRWAGVEPAPYMGKLWQRNYYEHIIRDRKSYQRISQYIINNPAKWPADTFHKK